MRTRASGSVFSNIDQRMPPLQRNSQVEPVGAGVGEHANGASAFGVQDMAGNVWEWVDDCVHGNYSGAPSEGSTWSAGGDCSFRVKEAGHSTTMPRLSARPCAVSTTRRPDTAAVADAVSGRRPEVSCDCRRDDVHGDLRSGRLGGGMLPCAELGANAALAGVVPATPPCGAASSGSGLRTVAPLSHDVQWTFSAEGDRLALRVRRRTAEAPQ